jgi:hypothetical protein
MQTLRTFFYALLHSLIDPRYYADIRRAKTSFSWKLLFGVAFLVTAVFASTMWMGLKSFQPEEVIDEVVAVYPSDLEVTISPEGWQINQPLPYAVPIPGAEIIGEGKDVVTSLVVFTTDEEVGTIPQVMAQKSFVVVTESSVHFRAKMDRPEVRSYPIDLSEMEPGQEMVISATMVRELANMAKEFPAIKYRLYIPAIMAAIVILMLPILLLVWTFTVAIYSVVVFFVASVGFGSRGLTYGEVFRLGLHGILPILLAQKVVEIAMHWSLSGVWFFLAYMGWMILVVSQLPEVKKTTHVAASSTKKHSKSKA